MNIDDILNENIEEVIRTSSVERIHLPASEQEPAQEQSKSEAPRKAAKPVEAKPAVKPVAAKPAAVKPAVAEAEAAKAVDAAAEEVAGKVGTAADETVNAADKAVNEVADEVTEASDKAVKTADEAVKEVADEVAAVSDKAVNTAAETVDVVADETADVVTSSVAGTEVAAEDVVDDRKNAFDAVRFDEYDDDDDDEDEYVVHNAFSADGTLIAPIAAEKARETVERAAKPAKETVERATKPAKKTVERAAKPAKEIVERAAKPAKKTVERAVEEYDDDEYIDEELVDEERYLAGDDADEPEDGYDEADEDDEEEPKSFVRMLFGDFIFIAAMFVIFLLLLYIFPPYIVDGPSMQKTLSDKAFGFGYRFATPDHGDIVIVNTGTREKGTNGESFIKRVIGVPGDTVKYGYETYDYDVTLSDGTVVKAGGNVYRVYLNGELLYEPYVWFGDINTARQGECTLGEDEYFVMGDNRFNSNDSRAFGPVNKSDIKCTMKVFLFGKHNPE